MILCMCIIIRQAKPSNKNSENENIYVNRIALDTFDSSGTSSEKSTFDSSKNYSYMYNGNLQVDSEKTTLN